MRKSESHPRKWQSPRDLPAPGTDSLSGMVFPEPSKAEGGSIAIIGGGGKTSLLHRLGRELAGCYPRVLLTSLTRSAHLPGQETFFLSDLDENRLSYLIERHNPAFVMGAAIDEHKLSGITEEELERIRLLADVCVFECDGARNLPLKAHNEHDPAVPEFASHAIIVVGADVVGTTVGDGLVHRPELFLRRWNIGPDMVLDSKFVARVVTSREGYLSRVPRNVECVYFVNKADASPRAAEKLALDILAESGRRTFYGSLWNRSIVEVA